MKGPLLGMVHGRFQPFHLGHLEYARMAAERCERLLVGITNPDPSHIRPEAADAHRSDPQANPFPYHLRYRMVRAALEDAGIQPAAIVPFPIHEPQLWPHYVPTGTTQFLRVFSDWGQEKRRRLEAAGYQVVVLDAAAGKSVSGARVRRLLATGGAWADLVPPAVAALVNQARVDTSGDIGDHGLHTKRRCEEAVVP